MPTADATFYSGSLNSRPTEVNFSYEYTQDYAAGVVRPVLINGSAYRRNGSPCRREDVPAHTRCELALRLPDEEHGWTWDRRGEADLEHARRRA